MLSKRWKRFLNRTVYLDTNVNGTSLPSQQRWYTDPVTLVTFGPAIRQPLYTWTELELYFGAYCIGAAPWKTKQMNAERLETTSFGYSIAKSTL